MPKVSIIVPVYNRASTIRFCLESIDAMLYRDFEVIVVDDGSSDDSPKICRKFCDSHAQFHYIRQDNGGVSNARNHGIREATGEWITFVDSDDAVSPEHLNVIKLEEENNVDWIIESFQMADTAKGKVQITSATKETFPQKVETEEPVKYIFTDMQKTDTPMFSTCGKFFKLSTCKEHKVLFNEKLSLDEDQLFVSTYIQYIKKMVHYPMAKTYINIDRPVQRLSGRLHTPENYFMGITENYNAFRKLDGLAEQNNIPYATNYLVNHIVGRILLGYTRPKNRNKISGIELKQFMKQYLFPFFQKISKDRHLLNVDIAYFIYRAILGEHYAFALFVCKSYNIYRSIAFKLKH